MTTALQILNALGSLAALFLAGTYVRDAIIQRRARRRALALQTAAEQAFDRLVRGATECDCENCTARRAAEHARAN